MFRRLFAKKDKQSDSQIEKIVLDAEARIESSGVLTESFGIRIYDGSIAPFAKKGEIYPASGSYTFSTTADYQDQITLEFHRGSESIASKESFLGTVRITGYKLRKAEEPLVRMHYSISDGKITLWATNEKENNKLSVTMLKNADGNILH